MSVVTFNKDKPDNFEKLPKWFWNELYKSFVFFQIIDLKTIKIGPMSGWMEIHVSTWMICKQNVGSMKLRNQIFKFKSNCICCGAVFNYYYVNCLFVCLLLPIITNLFKLI